MFDIPLALVVPFHNEEGGLPKVIEALRNQNTENISVVFVDNASTDGSRRLMYDCEEIRSGGWKLIREGRVGKFYAMETGTAFCVE